MADSDVHQLTQQVVLLEVSLLSVQDENKTLKSTVQDATRRIELLEDKIARCRCQPPPSMDDVLVQTDLNSDPGPLNENTSYAPDFDDGQHSPLPSSESHSADVVTFKEEEVWGMAVPVLPTPRDVSVQSVCCSPSRLCEGNSEFDSGCVSPILSHPHAAQPSFECYSAAVVPYKEEQEDSNDAPLFDDRSVSSDFELRLSESETEETNEELTTTHNFDTEETFQPSIGNDNLPCGDEVLNNFGVPYPAKSGNLHESMTSELNDSDKAAEDQGGGPTLPVDSCQVAQSGDLQDSIISELNCSDKKAENQRGQNSKEDHSHLNDSIESTCRSNVTNIIPRRVRKIARKSGRNLAKSIILPVSVTQNGSADNCERRQLRVRKAVTAEPKQGKRGHAKLATTSGCPFCSLCSLHFTSSAHLTTHQTKCHPPKDRKLKCHDCEYSTGHRSSFILHTRRHTGERPFSCTECGRSFKKRQHLNEHMWTHKSRDEYQYECNICQKKFALKKSLKVHLKFHSGDRPIACNECDRHFLSRVHFHNHQRLVHTGEKPFVCPQCEKGFSNKTVLKQHVEGVHMKKHLNQCEK